VNVHASVGAGDLRHLLVLDEVDGRKHVSQRTLARRLGLPASLVNRLIGELVEEGHVRVEDRSVRPFAYRITPRGERYRRRLSHRHFRSVLGSYRQLQEWIRRRLAEIRRDGVERIVFYGAGEVMEVTLPLAEAMGLEVVGVVDDDPEKQGEEREGLVVGPPSCVRSLEADAVLITTLRHAGEIRERIGEGGEGDGTVRVLEL